MEVVDKYSGINPKISIIVPVYNVEQYIERCIESILAQTYTRFELILIDDGGADDSAEICDKYAGKDSRIIVIHQENKGLSGARNSGLSIATGEFISFIDSDDAVSDKFLEILLSGILQTDADIIECQCVDVYNETMPKNKNYIGKGIKVFSQVEALNELILGREIRQTVWNKLYRRTALDGLCFPEGKIHEDEYYTWKVICRSRLIVKTDEPLYYYFHRAGSIMETFCEKRLDFFDARLERDKYISANYPNLSRDSKISIVLPCIFMTQKLLKHYDTELWKKCYPRLKKYYRDNRLSFDRMKELNIKLRISCYLANLSLKLCAAIRNLVTKATDI